MVVSIFASEKDLKTLVMMNTVIQMKNGEMMLLAPREADKYRPMSNQELCHAVRNGDRRAGAFLVFHRYGSVLIRLTERFADRECRDRLLSELVSEVYCHFEQSGWGKALARESDKEAAYLYVIEKNVLLRMQRRDFVLSGGGSVGTEEMERCLPPEEPERKADASDYVEKLLAGLSATRQFVMRKRHMEGYCSAEVAEMLPGFWNSIGEQHPVKMPTQAYVDNIVSRTTRQLKVSAGSRTWPESIRPR